MRIGILEKNNLLEYVKELQNNGATIEEIQEQLKNEKGLDVSKFIITNALAKCKSEAQDILYTNRVDIIRMRRHEFCSNIEIAQKFGVSEEDVDKFFKMRKRLSPEQHREIIYKFSQGKTYEEIADEYGVNPRSIEALVKKAGVITTSPRVMGNLVAKNEEEMRKAVEEVYDPQVVKDFTHLIDNIKLRYDIYTQDLDKFNDVRNDIYHQLELGDTSVDEQLKMLDKIKATSVERRKMKDFIEATQPLIDFLNENSKVIASLENVAGRIMNNLQKMETRVYFVRNMEEE